MNCNCFLSELLSGKVGTFLLFEYMATMIQCITSTLHRFLAVVLPSEFMGISIHHRRECDTIDLHKFLGVIALYCLLNFYYKGANLQYNLMKATIPPVKVAKANTDTTIVYWEQFRGINLKACTMLNHIMSIYRFFLIGRYVLLSTRIIVYAILCDRIKQLQKNPPTFTYPPFFESVAVEADFQIGVFLLYTHCFWLLLHITIFPKILRWISTSLVFIEYLVWFDILEGLPINLFSISVSAINHITHFVKEITRKSYI